MTSLYPLEASDEYGLQGVKNREDLMAWLNSWLHDDDSSYCKLEKLPNFNVNDYL